MDVLCTMVFVSVFQMNVLLKLYTILDMQKQQLTLLRRIVGASRAAAQLGGRLAGPFASTIKPYRSAGI